MLWMGGKIQLEMKTLTFSARSWLCWDCYVVTTFSSLYKTLDLNLIQYYKSLEMSPPNKIIYHKMDDLKVSFLSLEACYRCSQSVGLNTKQLGWNSKPVLYDKTTTACHYRKDVLYEVVQRITIITYGMVHSRQRCIIRSCSAANHSDVRNGALMPLDNFFRTWYLYNIINLW